MCQMDIFYVYKLIKIVQLLPVIVFVSGFLSYEGKSERIDQKMQNTKSVPEIE